MNENDVTVSDESEITINTLENLSPLKRAMLLKKSKKKARKTLEKQGFDRTSASQMVKAAVNKIAQRPIKRASGRGG
jgi:DNA polymerase III sliding clamp (beta) subunit (PCNA family)